MTGPQDSTSDPPSTESEGDQVSNGRLFPVNTPHAFPHPKPPRHDHVKIDWSESAGRSASFRIRSHTCECLPTIWELCAAGGLLHIRRTERTPQEERVYESPWIRTPEGIALWAALLEGRAR
ncbi:hypothetical protein GCM10009850_001310 [Nonomuraea monospora]|uniref:Uncharacterized protein n=1 Tax=Nonomuraea monospora TaxID=568818 RepID=A0ABN3C487_9ACTN